ncbi:MAG: phosphoenolpyruvate--protein phosphotransferase [Betaproteobacteria bacterium]|nr:phosphoenolpyruvate--protein phosphotransferase [Betaproteobacteria bacterium]MBK9608099.1 phosphoenolpyruvate--protein phosphotransferase [Betaproteobacteria bacterium]
MSVSFLLHGIGVSGGIAIGRAQLVSHATLEVAHYDIKPEQVPAEIERFDAAVGQVTRELDNLWGQIQETDTPSEVGAFIDVHAMLLRDETLTRAPREIIAEELCNAEWALVQQMNRLVEQFEQIEDAYLRERKQDVVQVVERVLTVLLGKPGQALAHHPEQRTVLVAHDLSPADMIRYKKHAFAAFLTDQGGATSHTAIVAKSLNIPAVVAVHNGRSLIRENEWLIVDGAHNVVIVNPDKAVLAEYRLKQEEFDLERQKLKRLKTKRATTLDGQTVELHANIELPSDVRDVLESGASGVGLFRSEFLFLNRLGLPTEDEQFEAYRAVAAGMGGRPVTIRTFDLGADKNMEGVSPGLDRVTMNPALGLRAVRFCLSEPHLFLTQLRAILRASSHGKVKILIPMLCNVYELTQVLQLIDRAKASLRIERAPFDENIAVGGMIEIPAAALSIAAFAERLDFLSIGTNDLIQYTLAIDRADDAVAHLYDPTHPAVLKLLAMAIRGANKAGIPIAVCGEMAGEVAFTRVLLGLGLREFSMHPNHVLAVKQRVLTSDVPQLEITAAKMLKTDDPVKIATYMERMKA